MKCQRVYILVNGIEAEEICLCDREGNVITPSLSKLNLQRGELMVINFSLPDAISPLELGISNDDKRALALDLNGVFQWATRLYISP